MTATDADRGQVFYIYELQVESGCQGGGLGKLLMRIVDKVAAEHHMCRIVLTCFKCNEQALNFYRKGTCPNHGLCHGECNILHGRQTSTAAESMLSLSRF